MLLCDVVMMLRCIDDGVVYGLVMMRQRTEFTGNASSIKWQFFYDDEIEQRKNGYERIFFLLSDDDDDGSGHMWIWFTFTDLSSSLLLVTSPFILLLLLFSLRFVVGFFSENWCYACTLPTNAPRCVVYIFKPPQRIG